MFYRRFAGKHKTDQYIKPAVIGLLILGVYFTTSFFFLRLTKFEITFNDAKLDSELTLQVFIFSFLISSLFTIGFSLVLAYLTFLRDERKQRKVLEEQKMQLEVEKTQANLNFLKAQINPHFLHNTLNFLYAKSLPYSSELSEGILTLSDIMRYALGPAAKDGKVSLKEEIEHVRNVIKINQLRFSNNLNVNFDVNGVVNGAVVVPFILITIVENAFKHGDLKSTDHPIEIKVDMLGGKRMFFFCRNKKKAGPKEISTGIGLDNIKKQLDLTYGRNYSLNVKDEAEFYTTELTITAV
jgi:LytS/YehU family sensor histidine kinase